MANEKKLEAEFKIRCSKEEKELLKNSAEAAGLSMSDYIRSIVFSDKKLILLSEGKEIAKALFLIHNNLECFHSSGGIPEESLRAITEALIDVSTQLNVVSEKLTDIHADCEEADSDE